MHDLSQQMEQTARNMLPGVTTILLFILLLLPVGAAGLAYFTPHVILISVYYWTIFRPNTMPYWFVFLLGILSDALFNAPLGLSSLIFILYRLLVLSQQHFLIKETFLAIWIGFGVSMVAAQVFHWLVLSLYQQVMLPVEALFMQWLFTIGIYPLVHMLFNLIYRHLPRLSGR